MALLRRGILHAPPFQTAAATRAIRLLHESLKMSPGEALAAQQQSLIGFLGWAATHVPHYRSVLSEAGVVSDDGSVHLEHFHRVPYLTKDIIRERFEDLKADDLDKRQWFLNSSGGSTGEPVRFIQDQECMEWDLPRRMLFDEWAGFRRGERKVVLWGSERDLFVGKETPKVRFLRWLGNELWLNAFSMTTDRMRQYAAAINEFRPKLLLAYADSAFELATFLERESIPIYSPGAVMTSAGTLHPHMRQTIERVFGTAVFNRYGSREVGGIASECSAHRGLHVTLPTHYVEVVRNDGTPAAPGEPGEVLVTFLVNRAMPLIRYRIGDMAAWSEQPCPCGRPWPTLQEVAGRVTDAFVTPDGGVVSSAYLIHLVGVMMNTGSVRKFQVVQEGIDSVRVLIVPAEGVDAGGARPGPFVAELRGKLRRAMGETCAVEVEYVAEIPPGPSGKHRYTVSRVSR